MKKGPGMATDIKILLGPAGSGKTESLLGHYLAAPEQTPSSRLHDMTASVGRNQTVGTGRLSQSSGTVQKDLPFTAAKSSAQSPQNLLGWSNRLWLAPTARAAASIRARLLSKAQRAVIEPGVTTFAQFAEQVISRQSGRALRISAPVKRWMLSRIVEEQLLLDRLPHYSGIARKPGFLDWLDRTIQGFKRREFWPEDFPMSLQQGSGEGHEVWLLYQAYQQRLQTANLYDAEGSFWWARVALEREAKQGKLPFMQCLVVDGFSDFTVIQREILAILTQHAKCSWISLPLSRDDFRKDLFARSYETLDALQSSWECSTIWLSHAKSQSMAPAIRRLSKYLFVQKPLEQAREEIGDRDIPSSSQVVCILASSQAEEARCVAEQVKRLLLAPAEKGDVPYHTDDIMIVVRNWGAWPQRFRRALGEFGIPYAIEASPTLLESPSVAALLRVLRLHRDDWPIAHVVGLLHDGYFCPDWPETLGGEAIRHASMLVRQLRYAMGKEALLERVALLYERAKECGDATDRSGARVFTGQEEESETPLHEEMQKLSLYAWPLLSRLANALQRLPMRASPAEWAKALIDLCQELGISKTAQVAPQEGTIRDKDALSRVWKVLAQLDQADGLLYAERRLIDAGELPELLVQWIRHENAPCNHQESGKVRVLSATTARSLRARAVFVVGLQDGEFPSASRGQDESGFSVGDELGAAPASSPSLASGAPGGHMLLASETAQERSAAEMVLFLETLSSASERLYLSYAVRDNEGRSVGPSPFLEDVMQALGETPHTIDLRSGALFSPSQQLAVPLFSSRQAREAAVRQLLLGKPNLLAALARSPELTVFPRLLAALEAEAGRTEGIYLGPYEGVIGQGNGFLASRFGNQRRWSTTQFQSFQQCPFRFFADYVLRLKSYDSLDLEDNFRRRGALFHKVLSVFHRRHVERTQHVTSGEVDPSHLVEVCDEVFEKESWHGPVDRALLALDKRWVAAWIEKYKTQYQEYASKRPLRPWAFEVVFGENQEWSLREENSLALQKGEIQVRITGRIDRVDRREENGEVHFSVIDYKTGKHSAGRGVDLQLAIYALAVEELLLAGSNAALAEAGYWRIVDKGFRPSMVSPSSDSKASKSDGSKKGAITWSDARSDAMQRIFQIVKHVRNGLFPVFNEDEDCHSQCHLAKICRVNTCRSLERKWPQTKD